ncbi:MAG TPA: aminotransferase class I/II-fold pyridoxal phosphate-dependent enzyme [Bryobacteraceae bacterium]|nr:aminotransferase class I/II-fold pyridoxal phosphate-dependent enzyme [Bryobacteraceae bacterium]
MSVTHGGNIFGAAEAGGMPWQGVLDFSASINPLGPSASAREAVVAALDRIVHYPERTSGRLRARLAREWGVEADRVMVGNGATELLFDWCRAMGNGTIAAPAFGEFHRAWPEARICLLEDPTTWPAEGPVVLTRPANPTGYLPELEAVLHYVKGRRGPVLVDESFLDFCEAESLLPHAGGNLYVLRSLTKFWALPGLRIGALAGDVATLAAGRAPWTVNVLAEEAALASLDDRAHAERTRAYVRGEGAWLAGQLSQWGVALPAANYLYVRMPHAAEFTAFAAARGVLVRDCSVWPGMPPEPAIRVAVRRRWENEILVSIFEEWRCE